MIDKFDGEYAFLSNFYEMDDFISLNGIKVPTVEHYFQAAKALNFNDCKQIITASTPGEAKRLGRKVKLRKDWESVKDGVMWRALIYKFSNPELAQKLISTGDEYLKEGNWWHDNYWGSCKCGKCQDHGQNKLGLMLMRIRDQLNEE
jgi:hypothetical protein